jgi:hypothetical protein
LVSCKSVDTNTATDFSANHTCTPIGARKRLFAVRLGLWGRVSRLGFLKDKEFKRNNNGSDYEENKNGNEDDETPHR